MGAADNYIKSAAKASLADKDVREHYKGDLESLSEIENIGGVADGIQGLLRDADENYTKLDSLSDNIKQSIAIISGLELKSLRAGSDDEKLKVDLAEKFVEKVAKNLAISQELLGSAKKLRMEISKLKGADAKKARLENKIAQQQEKLVMMESDKLEAINLITSLHQSLIAKHNEDIEKWKEQVRLKDEEIRLEKQRTTEAGKQLPQLEKEKGTLNAKIIDLTNKNNTLMSQVAEMEKAKTKIEAALDIAAKNKALYEAEIAKKRETGIEIIERHHKKEETLQKEKEEQEKKSKENIAKLESEITELKHQLELKDRDIQLARATAQPAAAGSVVNVGTIANQGVHAEGGKQYQTGATQNVEGPKTWKQIQKEDPRRGAIFRQFPHRPQLYAAPNQPPPKPPPETPALTNAERESLEARITKLEARLKEKKEKEGWTGAIKGKLVETEITKEEEEITKAKKKLNDIIRVAAKTGRIIKGAETLDRWYDGLILDGHSPRQALNIIKKSIKMQKSEKDAHAMAAMQGHSLTQEHHRQGDPQGASPYREKAGYESEATVPQGKKKRKPRKKGDSDSDEN